MKGCSGLIDKGIIMVEKRLAEQGDNEINIYSLRFREEQGGTIIRGVGNKVPYGRERSAPGVGNEVPPQETVLQETGFNNSNIRKSNSSNNHFVDNSASQPISNEEGRATAQTGASPHHGVEDLASIMARVAPQLDAIAPVKRQRGRPRKMPNVSPEIYEAVVGVMQDYTRKLGDGDHLASNITQAINLIVASGCDFNTFYMHVIDAYKITSQRNGLENRSRYFFTVLRDSLVPSDTVGTAAP
jgi:hypothetical protein